MTRYYATYDAETGSIYIYFADEPRSIARTITLPPDAAIINVDLDAHERPVGLELLLHVPLETPNH